MICSIACRRRNPSELDRIALGDRRDWLLSNAPATRSFVWKSRTRHSPPGWGSTPKGRTLSGGTRQSAESSSPSYGNPYVRRWRRTCGSTLGPAQSGGVNATRSSRRVGNRRSAGKTKTELASLPVALVRRTWLEHAGLGRSSALRTDEWPDPPSSRGSQTARRLVAPRHRRRRSFRGARCSRPHHKIDD